MFQVQFKLSIHESTACMVFGLFIALVYFEAWFSGTLACDAHSNNLCLLATLLRLLQTLE